MLYIYLTSVTITALLYLGFIIRMRNMLRNTFKSHFSHYLRTYRKMIDPPTINTLFLTILLIVVFPFNIIISLTMIILSIDHDESLQSLQMYIDNETTKYIAWCQEHCDADFCDDLIVTLDKKEE